MNLKKKIIKMKQINNKNLKYQSNSIVLVLFNLIGKEIPIDAEPIVNYSFNIFILSVIILLGFINLIGYFTSIYLINKYDIENKFPKYKKIIRYYEKSNLYFIFFEILMCFLALINLIFF